MFFTVRNLSNNGQLNRARAINSARKRIILYKSSSNEVALDNYLLEHYNLNLKLMCIKLINSCTWSLNQDNEVVITFKNKEYDKLAALITYGTEKLQGSQILAFAFHRDE